MNKKLHCNLSLCEILELTFLFVLDIPMSTVTTLTGKSANTVTDWFNMCQEVCTSIVSHQRWGKMVGTTENTIQIDEARFAVRWKYHRGRMLNRDNAPLSEDSDADQEYNRNHGRRIDGPWVFVLKQGLGCRYFWVEWCDRNTLIPIIERECVYGLVIHSDEWPA